MLVHHAAGKSLTFQFPPFTRPHAFTVVISPLLGRVVCHAVLA